MMCISEAECNKQTVIPRGEKTQDSSIDTPFDDITYYSFCDEEIQNRLNNKYIKDTIPYFNIGMSDY